MEIFTSIFFWHSGILLTGVAAVVGAVLCTLSGSNFVVEWVHLLYHSI